MINLDAMELDELYAFANESRGLRPRRAAHKYLGTSANGTTLAMRNLHHYAWNTITARLCRERGDIATAQMYEGIADRIYSELPVIARW